MTLIPNGGLNAHTIEMLWRSHTQVIGITNRYNIPRRIVRKFKQVIMYNLPTIILNQAELDCLDENFTACFFCVAEKMRD